MSNNTDKYNDNDNDNDNDKKKKDAVFEGKQVVTLVSHLYHTCTIIVQLLFQINNGVVSTVIAN